MSLGKKSYCTFVDFSKAFDTITRASLWVKLQKSNITGKNPVWDSEIKPTSSDNSHNLSFRTEVKVLLRHDTNVIGLYELGSLVSPLFL
jgi:hypothetical protein